MFISAKAIVTDFLFYALTFNVIFSTVQIRISVRFYSLLSCVCVD